MLVELIGEIGNFGSFMAKKWERYERVTAYLLDQFKEHFGLDSVEGKQAVSGSLSGTSWEIDAKGIRGGDEGFIIIECRRHTTSKQKQENLAALAYRILDTGAKGAIIVSPLGPQAGAQKIAEATNIISVRLAPESTIADFLMGFLNQVMLGVSDRITTSEDVRLEIHSAHTHD
jgi:hypothetical protein